MIAVAVIAAVAVVVAAATEVIVLAVASAVAKAFVCLLPTVAVHFEWYLADQLSPTDH